MYNLNDDANILFVPDADRLKIMSENIKRFADAKRVTPDQIYENIKRVADATSATPDQIAEGILRFSKAIRSAIRFDSLLGIPVHVVHGTDAETPLTCLVLNPGELANLSPSELVKRAVKIQLKGENLKTETD